MNDKLKKRLELFTTNTQIIKKDFPWQNTSIKRLSALLFTLEDKDIDCDLLHKCYDIVKENTDFFSVFRSNTRLLIATLLSLSDNKNELISNTIKVYDMMKELGFRRSDYLAMSAFQIASNTDPNKYSETVHKSKNFYDGMKEKHWFHTGSDDYIFSVMLSIADLELKSTLLYIEDVYAVLKPSFFSGNAVQSLTHVLALGDRSEEMLVRIQKLRNALNNEKIKLDKTYTLSSLGVLALLPFDVDLIANDVLEAYGFLREQKGFGGFSISKQELLIMVSALVGSVYADSTKKNILITTVCTSVLGIVIEQQSASSSSS